MRRGLPSGRAVCKVDVEVLWEPANFQQGGRVLCEQYRRGAVDGGVEQGIIENMIIFQKPFPGAARTELESQLQRAVKVSAKGKRVKCKINLERCLSGTRPAIVRRAPGVRASQGPRAYRGPARGLMDTQWSCCAPGQATQ